jgi:hypothetical protein
MHRRTFSCTPPPSFASRCRTVLGGRASHGKGRGVHVFNYWALKPIRV